MFASHDEGPRLKFNHDQSECIECDSNLLIVAPPGSGKTGTLIGKALRILKDPGNRIAMVTFTDAAAQEMRERLQKATDRVTMKRAYIETFHSHAIKQLRAAGLLGRIIFPPQAKILLADAIRRAGVNGVFDELQEQLEAAKCDLNYPDQAMEEPLRAVVVAYEALLREQRACDLNDILREAVVAMQSGQMRPMTVTHLLADEYQDADPVQGDWIRCHVDAGIVTTCVGDDDQSIYGWRRSMGVAGMEAFAAHANARRIHLRVNYRSQSQIIEASQCVIQNNRRRLEKVIESSQGAEGEVRLVLAAKTSFEAAKVLDLIREDLDACNGEWRKGRWSVLARTNDALRPLAVRLRAEGIPFSYPGARGVFTDQFLLFLRVMMVLARPDSIELRDILGKLNINEDVVDVAKAALGGELAAVLCDPTAAERARSATKDRAFGEWLDKLRAWRGSVENNMFTHACECVREALAAEFDMSDASRDEFIATTEPYCEARSGSGGNVLWRIERLLDPPTPDRTGALVLMTLHASKGLEFDNVAIIRCNSGVIPSAGRESDRKVDVEEERRLFYVGMTRARRRLYVVTHPSVPMQSTFVSEIGHHLQGS